MAFKTRDQIFGDDGANGAKVPVSESNPSGTAAANRGIQFGEQVTAAVQNRPSFALADNTDNLNARVGSFETDGLDAAYRLGGAAVAGGGRVITKDGGAVETQSALATQYADDAANAHFRATALGDSANGSVGLDLVGHGRATVGGNPAAGILDRRALTPATSRTTLAASIAITTNVSGGDADSLTIGAGNLTDGGGETELQLGFDLVEILTGDDVGLYIIRTLDSATKVSVYNLDGSSPSFTSDGAGTARFFRPVLASSARYGGGGELKALMVSGSPGQDSALDILAGGSGGGLVSPAPDGAQMALRVRKRSAAGALASRLTVDAAGRVTSTTTTDDLTAAQKIVSGGIGAASFTARQDAGSGNPTEVGFLARSNHASAMARHLGVLALEDTVSAGTPTGVYAFNFFASNGIDFTDVAMADSAIFPGFTLVEIITPSLYAGTYLVTYRASNDGEVTLSGLAGGALSFPGSGAGTARVLYGSALGSVDMTATLAVINGSTNAGRAAAVIQSPKESEGSSLVLESSIALGEHLIRGFGTEDGGTAETFRVEAVGNTYAGGEYLYTSARTKRIKVSLTGWECSSASGTAYTLGLGSISSYMRTIVTNSARISKDITDLLYNGNVISDVRIVCDPGGSRTGTNRLSVALHRFRADFTTPANNPIDPTNFATVGGSIHRTYEAASSGAKQVISLAADGFAGHTIAAEGTTAWNYVLEIQGGNDATANNDQIFGIELVLSVTGVRAY